MADDGRSGDARTERGETERRGAEAAPPPLVPARKFRYLDVAQVRDGLARLRLYFATIAMLVLSGGLSLLYETTLLRPWDRDARDMLLDKRITGPASQKAHDEAFRAATIPYWSEGGNAATASLDIPAIRFHTATPEACAAGYPVPCLADETAVSTTESLINGSLVLGTTEAFQNCDELRDAMSGVNASARTWQNAVRAGLGGVDVDERRRLAGLNVSALANEACLRYDELRNATCPRLLETCTQMDRLLRAAVGLEPYNASRVGRVVVLTRTNTILPKNRLSPPSRPILLAYSGGNEFRTLEPNKSRAYISPSDVEALVADAMSRMPTTYEPPVALLGNVSLPESVFVDGARVGLGEKSTKSGNLKPSRWGWENDLYPGTYPCSDTAFAKRWLSGKTSERGTRNGATGARFNTVVFGTSATDSGAKRAVVARHVLREAAPGDTVRVARLTRIVVRVVATALVPRTWTYVGVDAEYEDTPRTVARSALRAELDASFAVDVDLRDAGEPSTNKTPAGQLGWEYLLGGIVIGGLGFLTSWNMPNLLYIMVRNARENRNQAPPFYRSNIMYRGW